MVLSLFVFFGMLATLMIKNTNVFNGEFDMVLIYDCDFLVGLYLIDTQVPAFVLIGRMIILEILNKNAFNGHLDLLVIYDCILLILVKDSQNLLCIEYNILLQYCVSYITSCCKIYIDKCRVMLK